MQQQQLQVRGLTLRGRWPPICPVTQSQISFILLNVPNSRQRKSLTFYGYDSEFIKYACFYVPTAVATLPDCNSSKCHAQLTKMADTKSGREELAWKINIKQKIATTKKDLWNKNYNNYKWNISNGSETEIEKLFFLKTKSVLISICTYSVRRINKNSLRH